MNRAKDISSKTVSKEKVVQSALQVASSCPNTALDKDEMAMLSAFREMDDLSRAHILAVSQAIAEQCPKNPRPKLRLVHGGAK